MPLTEEEKQEVAWFRRVLAERIKARAGEIALAAGVPSVSPSAAETIARIAVEEMVSVLEQVEREESEGVSAGEVEGV